MKSKDAEVNEGNAWEYQHFVTETGDSMYKLTYVSRKSLLQWNGIYEIELPSRNTILLKKSTIFHMHSWKKNLHPW